MTKRILCLLPAACAVFAAETVFEVKGPLTDKTPGIRFGNVVFTDNDRVCARFEAAELDDKIPGRLTTDKLRLPNKEPGKGAYFKFSFDAQYTFASGKGGPPQRCNQGVFFYDEKGRVLPDCYDTMYPGDAPHHYERVLYAWDEVDSLEIFFQKPWNMRTENGDTCTLNVSNLKVETATWEDAARFCDATYAKLPPLEFTPTEDFTRLLPRTMEAFQTGRPWRVVMLGDSIVQDTFHSQFHALVKRAFPQSNVEWILSMRGGTGCWYYILADNFYSYVVDHRPDLLIIGGISNARKHDETPLGRDVGPTGPEAMVRVAKLARERLGCEALIVNNPLAVDYRPYDAADPDAPLPKMSFNVHHFEMIRDQGWDYGRLKNLCDGAGIPWWDAFVPCYDWLFRSELPFGHFSRDAVHSGELGKQIIGHVMLRYFTSGK
ncbi:MAG: SGNH/GDSL hydrolase family protein [Kiritimatiellia bacterium]